MFNEDAQYLFLSRYSVVQRIEVCELQTDEIFADGFESGDISAWGG